MPKKLLIVTQSVDTEDSVLGFFVRWIEEFAQNAEHVEVICLKSGKFNFPKNVRVHSLGKEKGVTRITYVVRFYTHIWRLRDRYDAVFVHMNPEYVILGWPVWRLLGKTVVLWYVHRAVNMKLRVASALSDAVATATPESFRIPGRRIMYAGHGIETDKYSPEPHERFSPARLVSVGRITPIKNIDILIRAVALLKDRGIEVEATCIGAPVQPGDMEYKSSLRDLAEQLGVDDRIHFIGNVTHSRMPEQYQHYDLSVNLSPTGGMDKAVLESMASGLPIVTSNNAFAPLLGRDASAVVCKERDPKDCADKIEHLLRDTEGTLALTQRLVREAGTMSVRAVVNKIFSLYEAGR